MPSKLMDENIHEQKCWCCQHSQVHGCRLVRYTAAKSFESFQKLKSVEDEKKSVDNEVPKSTAYKTKWACKVVAEWKQT